MQRSRPALRVDLEEAVDSFVVAQCQVLVIVRRFDRSVEEDLEASSPLSVLPHVLGPDVGEVVELRYDSCFFHCSVQSALVDLVQSGEADLRLDHGVALDG